MKHEPQISGPSLGYVSSGRFMADIFFERAMEHRKAARWCFRVGLHSEGRADMHQALRAWKNYRWYRERIVQ